MATILVCDDDKDIVEAISIYLEQEGHQILKAYDGQQALLVLQKNEVDLLIIDVMMPKLDGIRATLKIREEHSLPIIILSAKSEDADKILGLNVGACLLYTSTNQFKMQGQRALASTLVSPVLIKRQFLERIHFFGYVPHSSITVSYTHLSPPLISTWRLS